MFKKILCALDYSLQSDHALRTAARLARRDSELVLVHVWNLPEPLSRKHPLPAELAQMLASDADEALARATREASWLGAQHVTSRLLRHVPWQSIVHAAEDDPAIDLVVIGTHGRSGIPRVLLGSVAERVVRHAACSVLVTRGSGDPRPFAHVLCPIDFSESARAAVDRAAELTAPDGNGILLLHACEMPAIYNGRLDPTQLAAIEENATRQLATWARALRANLAVPVTTRLVYGGAGAAALHVLDEDPTFDLVVLGSHGRTGLRRAFLGSVAEKVVRHAPCSVLVARPERDQASRRASS